jgi:hypothetical protein
MEALLGNLGEGSCVEEGSGMGVSPYRGPTGEPGKDFEGSRNGASPLKRLNVEGLEGGLFYWGPWKMLKKAPTQASLSIGAPLHLRGT